MVGNSTRDFGQNGLFWAFVWFGLGLGACLAAYFFGANSQDHLMNAAFNEANKALAQANQTGEEFTPEVWDKRAEVTLTIAGGLAVASLLFFLIGAFVALYAIT